MDIMKFLSEHREEGYRDFQAALIPVLNKEIILGVRMPVIRRLAADINSVGGLSEFTGNLPHKYYEENQLHAVLLSDMKSYCDCIEQTEKFLEYVDNWSTCDTLSPKVFSSNKKDLLLRIGNWLRSPHAYTVRFAIKMMMEHFLDDNFSEEYLCMVLGSVTEEYYVKMMTAWYFATGLSKQYESFIKYLENGIADKWLHNKIISKAVESRRIPDCRKQYIRSLRKM